MNNETRIFQLLFRLSGWDQKYAAERCGVADHSSISKYLSGDSEIGMGAFRNFLHSVVVLKPELIGPKLSEADSLKLHDAISAMPPHWAQKLVADLQGLDEEERDKTLELIRRLMPAPKQKTTYPRSKRKAS